MGLKQDIERAARTFRKVGDKVRREKLRILSESAAPMVQAAKMRAPRSSRPHSRYAPNKGKRAGKGEGQKLATYYPGNLSRSIRVMRFARAKSSVYVGARLAKKGSTGGEFKGARVDGFYLQMVEQGRNARPFYLAAVEATRGEVQQNIIRAFRAEIEPFNNLE